MVGIISYGAYIPLFRLNRTEIAKAWEGIPMPGEKAVARYDEDSITMAVAAASDCLAGMDPQKVDALYFATTTSPYKEKQASTIIAAALDLREDAITADFADSLRAGTTAIGAAMDAIKSGSAKTVLVVASDCRLGASQGMFEQAFGDGAAAFVIGDSSIVAHIEDRYSISNAFLDIWRADTDTFVRSWEDRWVRDQAYSPTVKRAILELLKRGKLTPRDITKVVIYPLDARSHIALARGLGFDTKTQVQDSLLNSVGNAGAAHTLMMLVSSIEEAKAGDSILVAGYGDGTDVLLLKVSEEIEGMRDRRGIKNHLAAKAVLASYDKYVRWRQLMAAEASARPERLPVSVSALWRERKGILALYGSKCKLCGTPQYPRQRICVICQAKDDYEDYRFADKRGKVFTFTEDRLAAAVDSPVSVTIVDFDGGGRGFFDMTDCIPGETQVGMPVEMTFRKIAVNRGVHNYFWKARPVRC